MERFDRDREKKTVKYPDKITAIPIRLSPFITVCKLR